MQKSGYGDYLIRAAREPLESGAIGELPPARALGLVGSKRQRIASLVADVKSVLADYLRSPEDNMMGRLTALQGGALEAHDKFSEEAIALLTNGAMQRAMNLDEERYVPKQIAWFIAAESMTKPKKNHAKVS
jgi:hypothetical protein